VLRDHGIEVEGFDVWIASTIPVGGGVSSSAALCVSLLRGLRALQRLDLDDHAIARLAQRVETDFVGAPVGIMDQMACSLGAPGEALFIDTGAIAYERIPWPAGVELVVIDSGVSHQHAGGGYVDRRRESFAAAEALGVSRLRDVGIADLPRIAQLPDVQARRARHIVTENQRVLDTVAALRAGDLPAVGALFAASHASMRDDYEITTPEIDRLVAIGQADPSIYGARMTGGGFGGAVVMLARAGDGRAAAERIVRAYEAEVRRRAGILSPLAVEHAAARA
jgi:galactokinase